MQILCLTKNPAITFDDGDPWAMEQCAFRI